MKVSTAFCQIMVLFLVAMTASSQTPTPRSSPIGVGDSVPDFTLEDQNNNKVTLSDPRGKSPVVLVFYRGYW
jgi:cytochrome oxidase Cu insertion factor (SCO1/SenC/PrrC family)